MFSLTEMSFAVGLLLGPLICGALAESVGFYWTSCALGKLHHASDEVYCVNGDFSDCGSFSGLYVFHLLHASSADTGAVSG